MESNFHQVHLKHPMPDATASFDITCSPGTDIWAEAPSTRTFNAPIIYQTTTKAAFISARLTVSADFKDRFDQGGLCFVIRTDDRIRWVKSGIEVEFGVPWVSTVVKDEWADCSMREQFVGSKNKATIEIKDEDDGDLWVYALGPNGERKALREISWWGAVPDATEIWVGAYSAKPAPNGENEDFTAHFEGFNVRTK